MKLTGFMVLCRSGANVALLRFFLRWPTLNAAPTDANCSNQVSPDKAGTYYVGISVTEGNSSDKKKQSAAKQFPYAPFS